MASKPAIETNVKAVYSDLQSRYNGVRAVVHFLQDHLRSAYKDFMTKRYPFAGRVDQVLIETATYAVLFCSINEFRQHLQAVINHFSLVYIAFLLCKSNRKYIGSIVFHENYRMMRMEEKKATVKAFIKQQLQGICKRNRLPRTVGLQCNVFAFLFCLPTQNT